MVNIVEELKNMIALIKYHSKEIAVDLEVYHFKEIIANTSLPT